MRNFGLLESKLPKEEMNIFDLEVSKEYRC